MSLNTDFAPDGGVLLGRARVPGVAHPCIVTVREGELVDITSAVAPLVRDICEMENPASHVAGAPGRAVGSLAEAFENSRAQEVFPDRVRLLSPVDLQAIKAAGVTFVASMLERVVEEQAGGDPQRAEALREEIVGLIGTDLSKIVPGSKEAMTVKDALLQRGVWSQYLEVGIGPDAEIFTKAQPMSSVGFGVEVGLHPVSKWNNPEPEIVLVVSSKGRIVGATMGNDVNLRDVEGRSALLLGKAKDNNASAAIGPFIRLFDKGFNLESVKSCTLALSVTGEDGFVMEGTSSMSQISRKPEALVEATIGAHHQYPDGLALYLGTMFAPVKDRDGAGQGFTHHRGDIVRISTPALGVLENRVQLSTRCAPWDYGTSHLLRDLGAAGLR